MRVPHLLGQCISAINQCQCFKLLQTLLGRLTNTTELLVHARPSRGITAPTCTPLLTSTKATAMPIMPLLAAERTSANSEALRSTAPNPWYEAGLHRQHRQEYILALMQYAMSLPRSMQRSILELLLQTPTVSIYDSHTTNCLHSRINCSA
jgi:hypothetical protein